MSGEGPVGFSFPIFTDGFYFGGAFIAAKAGLIPIAPQWQPRGAQKEMLAGNNIAQLTRQGGNQPINLNPRQMRVGIQLNYEADYISIMDRVAIGEPVDVWFDWPILDRWYIPGQDLGTEWKFSRKLPFGQVPGISQSTRPPLAWFVDYSEVLQSLTVITTGTPGTLEIKIPDAAGYQLATTAVGDADQQNYKYLRIQYSCMMMCRVRQVGLEYPDHNALDADLEMVEHFGGLYTLATGETL